MTGRNVLQIIDRIRSHSDPERGRMVVMDIIHRIVEGEDLNGIEVLYHEDLELMRKGA